MRPLVASLVVSLILVACRRDVAPTVPVSSQAVGEHSLAYVSADTPYVFVAANRHGNNTWLPDPRALHDVFIDAARKSADTSAGRMFGQFAAELRDGARFRAASELGLTTSSRFVLYGLALWPVVRLEIADAAKVRAVATRVFAAGGSTIREQQHAGIPYWVGAIAAVSYIVAVRDRELVAALVPSAHLDRALPLVLGTERPVRSLASERRLEQAADRNGFLRDMIGYVDARIAIDLLTGGGQGLARDLGAFWNQDGTFAGCRDDFTRLAAAFPNMVLGYRRIDARGISGALVVEAPEIGAALSDLRTVVPDLVAGGPPPLAALAVAMDAGKLVTWPQQMTDAIAARPRSCAMLGMVGDRLARFATALASLPAVFRGLQGFAVTVDDLDLERQTGTGAALAVGDGLPMVLASMWPMLPFANAPVPSLGAPVALPLQQLGLAAGFTAHVAVGLDRVAVAAGADSGTRVRKALAAKPAKRTPLVGFHFDGKRMHELDLVTDETRPQSELDRFYLSLDATPHGIVLDFEGTWTKAPR